MPDHYVYCYIDPRNHEEFYYGKGQGSRKYAHLHDKNDTEKVRRINQIKKEGLLPIIKVIAANLTNEEAFLIEKTLLWKQGKFTTNISTGSFADKFRPLDTLHKNIAGFDFQSGIYYYNVGESKTRNWDDYLAYGFISAGQGQPWRDAMLSFNAGDIIVAYLKKHGFVGVGRITETAKRVSDVFINGIPLLNNNLKCDGLSKNSDDPEKSEYVCKVDWLRSTSRKDAFWMKKSGLYTTTHVRASLVNQRKTLDYIQKCFEIDLISEAS